MRNKALFLLMLLSFLWIGCSKKSTIRRYYIIELASAGHIARPDSSLFDLKVDVRDFRVARAFDQTRIALRTDSNELNYYFYHHWAVKPSQAVADFVYDLIEQKNMFSRNFRGISYNPMLLITGEIKSIEFIREKKRSFAHVHMQLEFLDAESEKTLVRYEEDQRLEFSPSKSMNAFARATSTILSHLTNEFLDQVVLYLEDLRALEIE